MNTAAPRQFQGYGAQRYARSAKNALPLEIIKNPILRAITDPPLAHPNAVIYISGTGRSRAFAASTDARTRDTLASGVSLASLADTVTHKELYVNT